MKVFISYKFTGEDHQTLKGYLGVICESLTELGLDYYCSFGNEGVFRDNGYTAKEIMSHAFGELDQCDAVLVFLNSDNKSEGMLIEVGYAIANQKPIILLQREKVFSHSLRGVANQILEFTDLDNIKEQIKSINV